MGLCLDATGKSVQGQACTHFGAGKPQTSHVATSQSLVGLGPCRMSVVLSPRACFFLAGAKCARL